MENDHAEVMQTSSLELIHEQFLQMRREIKILRKRKRIHRGILALFFLLSACLMLLWIFLPVWMDHHSFTGAADSEKRASVTEQYREWLTPQEIEAWNNTRLQSGKVFLKMKTEIQVSEGTKAYIRLINPPYCAYDCRFRITEEDTGQVLYESDILAPGTVQNYAGLGSTPDYGETPVVVKWLFYRHGKERVIRTEEVQATLVTAD